MSDVEMHQTGSKKGASAVPSAWPRWTLVSVSHLVASVLLITVAVAAGVGLGQEDWYTHQLYSQTINKANVFGPSAVIAGSSNPGWQVNYYGLRSVVTCSGAPTASPPVNWQTGTSPGVCTVNLYSGLRKLANADDSQDSEESAWKHLQGAGDIIIVLLSFTILFSILGAYHNFFHAFHYSLPSWFANRAREQRMSRMLALLAFLLELLILILWVTIFPYNYVNNSEFVTGPIAGAADFTYYYTLGSGFSIQIAGLFIALFAFVINGKNPHDGNAAAATPSGV